MMQETAASCTPSPEVTLLRSIFDVKSWLSPIYENLHGHSTPHCFKFLLGTSGRALMFFKLCSHDPWCDDKDAVVLLKVNKHKLPKNNCFSKLTCLPPIFLICVGYSSWWATPPMFRPSLCGKVGIREYIYPNSSLGSPHNHGNIGRSFWRMEWIHSLAKKQQIAVSGYFQH